MDNKMEELREIEAQRTDLLAKLNKIEEKKTSVSEKVFTKVKLEYEEKLKELEQKMAGHVDLIKKELKSLKHEETKLAKQQDDLNFVIEEIDLRYSIGEYDEESYKKLNEENSKTLNTLKTQLESVRERKQRFQDIIEIKSIEETIEEAPEVPAETAEAAPEVPLVEVEASPEAEVPAEESLEAILETPPEATPEETPIEMVLEEEPATAEPDEAEPAVEEIAAAEPQIEIEEHILEETLSKEAEMKLDELLTEDKTPTPEAEATTEDTGEQTADEESKTGEEGKNVACPKCGHMNAPDSWYCEKCGAEVLDSPAT